MTHPITPPPDLVQQWADKLAWSKDQVVFTRAAQWGADQELEACCEWLERNYNYPQADHPLRTARRPKSPSLKEQALEQLRKVNAMLQFQTTGGETSAIRRALEALPND
jgi:hypothetical protein